MKEVIKRSEIQELSKKVVKFTNGQSTIACVMVLSSVLDEAIRQLVKARLVVDTNREGLDPLLDGNGSLVPFKNRIQTAYRLGLISRELSETLNIVAKIRNSYAHYSIDVLEKGETQEFNGLAAALYSKINQEWRDLIHDKSSGVAKKVTSTEKFNTAVIVLLFDIQYLPGSTRRLDEFPKEDFLLS